MKTQSTAEAMALLKKTRKALIEEARGVALGLIGEFGSTHTREVFAVMKEAGTLPPYVTSHHWLGRVFYQTGKKRGSLFKWTGAYHAYSDPEQNIHERTIKVWTWNLED